MPGQIDLSKATKLQRVVFRCGSLGIGWIAATLETVTSNHQDFQQVSLNFSGVRDLTDVNPGVGWPVLDNLLVRFWESCSIRTKLGFTEPQRRAGGMMDLVKSLLPGSTKREIIDPVQGPVLFV